MKTTVKLSFLAGLVASVAGCSGTGTPSGVSFPAVTSTGYEKLDSAAVTTSALKGSGYKVSGGKTTPDPLVITGTLTHNTGAIGLKGDETVLFDANGPDSTQILVDGVVKTFTGGNGETASLIQSTGSEYAAIVTATDNNNAAGRRSFFGVVGIGTKAADMPPGGTANYTGPAVAVVGNANGQTNLTSLTGGTSTITANFATSKVNVDMHNFTKVTTSGNIATTPIDRVTITGMDVTGADLSGGTIATSLNGNPVAIIGAGNRETTDGSFYGPVAGTPAEIGGSFVIENGNAFVTGNFIGR